MRNDRSSRTPDSRGAQLSRRIDPVRERFGKMEAAYLLDTIKIGDRSRELQDTVKATRRKMQTLGSFPHKREPCGVRLRN